MEIIKPLVGNTPLIKISRKIYAKLETYNPSGSVKDRMIAYVVRRAQLYGYINDKTIPVSYTHLTLPTIYSV